MADLLDILFNDFRSSKKMVNRLLGIWMLFALVSHFYVVEPYFRYKPQELVQSELREYAKSVEITLKGIDKDVISYPDHLRKVRRRIIRSFKNNLPSKYNNQASNQYPKIYYEKLYQIESSEKIVVGDITLPAEINFDEAVGQYVRKWFSNLITKLNAAVSKPKNGQKGIEVFDFSSKAIKAGDDFKNDIRNLEQHDHYIWRNYEGNKGTEATKKLQELVDLHFDSVKQEVSNLLKNAENQLKDIENDIGSLEPRIQSLLKQFGIIPVGLNDFVILFPLVVVALVVIITFAFHKSSRLYSDFRRISKEGNKNIESATFHHLTDCWYLPYKDIHQALILLALLVANLGMFGRAGLLIILESKSIADDFPFNSRFVPFSIYVVGLVAIIWCALFTRKTLLRVTQDSK